MMWSVSWKRARLVCATAVVAALAGSGVALADEAPAASPAAAAAGTPIPAGITATEDGARWESGYGDKFYQVVGTVKNSSSDTVGAVLIRTELLDDSGKVVATFDGWNARAEALGDLTGPAALAELANLSPGPIAPGTTDRFRATFIEEETPKFTRHRVRVLNVLPPAN
jgi:hypothetical protein